MRVNEYCTITGSGKGEFCHRFCLMCMDDRPMSVNLKECPTGCRPIAGGRPTIL